MSLRNVQDDMLGGFTFAEFTSFLQIFKDCVEGISKEKYMLYLRERDVRFALYLFANMDEGYFNRMIEGLKEPHEKREYASNIQ